MTMLNHIIISTSHGSPKKAVDHTSGPASLPPPCPPTGGHVHPKRDDHAYAFVNSSPSIRPPWTQETQSHM